MLSLNASNSRKDGKWPSYLQMKPLTSQAKY